MGNSFIPAYEQFYGQRFDKKRSAVEKFLRNGVHKVTSSVTTRKSRVKGFVARVNRFAESAEFDVSNEELARALRVEARRNGISDEYTARAFALIRRVAEQQLGMRHFDVQLIGGWAMMNGMVAEMDTGQGKTLTATLAAGAAALAGFPTHVITVNEYLASRDAEWMAPVYEALGLTVGVVTNEMPAAEKQEAYRRDVAYCTNKQIAFDYLRDRIEIGKSAGTRQMQLESLYNPSPVKDRLLLRGLHFAIVDEADSILIDEAVTPLIISSIADNNARKRAYESALEFARTLEKPRDFKIYEYVKAVELTNDATRRLDEWGESRGGLWKSRVIREELVSQALRALHLYERDQQYLVTDDKVQIVDEFTGRLMPDRNWEGGLHQMIELKEGCEMSGDSTTMARISYQRFFRRYLNLSGMTGTAREVGKEIRSVYGMNVFRIPPAQKVQRVIRPDHASIAQAEKWQTVVARIEEVHASGRPILVGTRSVEGSEHLSRLLTEKGIDHQLLNARQDKTEAEVVAMAGKVGRITVATNMAGRGTDIKLEDDVREIGGLHVIMTERHDSRRIDRQLFGRCGRQGDPGTAEAYVSLEDDLLSINIAALPRNLILSLAKLNPHLRSLISRIAFNMAQNIVQRRHYVMRRNVLKMDEQHGDILAFSGRME